MEKRIPLDFVPFKYLMTRLTVSICPFVGMTVYFAIMFVIVDMPGLVDIDSQLRHPTNFCMCLTYDGLALSAVIVDILSTGALSACVLSSFKYQAELIPYSQ